MVITKSISTIREDFPILSREVNGRPLIYFDNGATTQKPKSVIETISNYYSHTNSNIHRGVHTLSQEATSDYEVAREAVQSFLNAQESCEVIFTTGTTGAINTAASILKKGLLQKDDEIIITAMCHHSNIVPWQMVCEEIGCKLKVIPMDKTGTLLFDEYLKLLSPKTKLVAFPHISNTLGTINPAKEIIKEAHKVGALVLVDGAQAVAHQKVDVQELDADFYCFSAHKLFGPTGVGILYGKKEVLDKLPPYQGGGDMIKTVTFEKTTYNELPHKLEAGTPNIAGGIGLKAAIDYVNEIGFDFIHQQEENLLQHGTKLLKEIDGVKIIGEANQKASVISFVVEGIHPYDIGVLLDKMGVAVRTGHHCTQPIMDFFEIPGTIRASFAFYNTIEEINIFIDSLKKAILMLS